jgi:hypothetical protein
LKILPATVPARSAGAFLAHPTRFERVTFASRAFGEPGPAGLRYILKMKLGGQVIFSHSRNRHFKKCEAVHTRLKCFPLFFTSSRTSFIPIQKIPSSYLSFYPRLYLCLVFDFDLVSLAIVLAYHVLRVPTPLSQASFA